MPYNTTAIPPRKEVTGQAQLPLSRVKKIIAQDQDIAICSNNAAFVITLATEMFIQYLAGEGLNMAKLERKPRRNIQYKDLANAVSHQDNLQFLEDIIPKTVPYRQIKAHAAATRANLSGGTKASADAAATTSSTSGVAAEEDARPTPPRQANGKKQKSRASANGAAAAGGNRSIANFIGASGARIVSEDDASMDPNEQLHDEMRRANRGEDEDVDMAD
ncbi:histone-fold-containing protein [Hypoxylon argillaceum]|nr:histone-fold-containing protein [Hypoxylon argillaceum]